MKLFNEDCLITTTKLTTSSIDLIYLDPPFFTQNMMKSSDLEFSFSDKWESMSDYLSFMKKRIAAFKELLKETGSIFVHCDRNASHYLKVLLDEVFGEDNFQSEIVWSYKRWSNAKKGLLNSHQIILFYSKTQNFKFNQIYTDYSSTTNIDQILQLRKRDENGKCVYDTDSNGRVLTISKKGVPLSDVWEIPFLNPKAKERVNYPTQKPIELLERIIELVTDEGDVVFDPFCGSGTTLVASKLMNREYLGSDISKDAIELTMKRLNSPIKTKSHLLEKGYDSYKNQDDKTVKILKRYGARVVQRNNSIDGIIASVKHGSVPVKVITSSKQIENAVKNLVMATKKKNLTHCMLILTDEVWESLYTDEKKYIDGINLLICKDVMSAL